MCINNRHNRHILNQIEEWLHAAHTAPWWPPLQSLCRSEALLSSAAAQSNAKPALVFLTRHRSFVRSSPSARHLGKCATLCFLLNRSPLFLWSLSLIKWLNCVSRKWFYTELNVGVCALESGRALVRLTALWSQAWNLLTVFLWYKILLLSDLAEMVIIVLVDLIHLDFF